MAAVVVCSILGQASFPRRSAGLLLWGRIVLATSPLHSTSTEYNNMKGAGGHYTTPLQTFDSGYSLAYADMDDHIVLQIKP